ncbi:WcaF family extracellular polysaccharide biosynthesis acetyltransferase [Vibrio breoganii]|uniref:WcaF family extracellular polysaccharide biosynthesis acetyltransferase n=1 Tax=Vibrio breoganii TaxID=553239 RepID=UPI000CB4CD7C|nr:WcaF family extracellular polysaccharide biosynthesis acetyltransferase [Vibrio breoganii]PMK16656.1 acyl transferase [Vibrio breoganii]
MVRLDKYAKAHNSIKFNILVVLWTLVRASFFLTSLPFPSRLKVFWLRSFGAHVGSGVVIKPNVNIKYPWNLTIGDYSWVGENVWVDNLAKVKIGCHCCLSQGSYILTGSHNYKHERFTLIVSEVEIEDGSWVGAKSTVCPGVTVGKFAVLTVGSVARQDLLPDGIYSGNPAQLTRKRTFIDEPSI